MKKLSLIILTLWFSTILLGEQKSTISMKKKYVGIVENAPGTTDFPIGTYILTEHYASNIGVETKEGIERIYGLKKSKKNDLSKFLGKKVVVTAKIVDVKKSGVLILEIETIQEISVGDSSPEIQQLKYITWSISDVSFVNSRGNLLGLQIYASSATLIFSDNTFEADFCYEMKGNYTFQKGKLLFENIKKDKNYKCSAKEGEIGRKPNIYLAQDILDENVFDIEIDKNRLILSNSKGKLFFEKSPF